MSPEFTPQEEKMIERLRKQERCWPRLRWFWLIACGLALINGALWGYLFSFLLHILDPNKADYDTLLVMAIIFAKAIISIAVAIWVFSWVIRDWHGNVTRMLLLRLLDAQNSSQQASKIV